MRNHTMNDAVLSLTDPDDQPGDDWEDAPTNPYIPLPHRSEAKTSPEIPRLLVHRRGEFSLLIG